VQRTFAHADVIYRQSDYRNRNGGGARSPAAAGLTGIPAVHAGDSVWWHCGMIHSVAPVANQQGWENVMYIPAGLDEAER
jgi:Protein of unknown function (DUF1479)